MLHRLGKMCTSCSKSYVNLKDYLSDEDSKILYKTLLNTYQSGDLLEWIDRQYTVICFFGTGSNGKSVLTKALEMTIKPTFTKLHPNENVELVTVFPKQKVLLCSVSNEDTLEIVKAKAYIDGMKFVRMNFLYRFKSDPEMPEIKIKELMQDFHSVMD